MNTSVIRWVVALVAVFSVSGCQAPATQPEDTESSPSTGTAIPASPKNIDEVVKDKPVKTKSSSQNTSEDKSTASQVAPGTDKTDAPQPVDTATTPQVSRQTQTETDTPLPAPVIDAQPAQDVEEIRQTRGTKALPEQNKFYDRDNPAYSILQKANQAMAGFPLDKRGGIDWMVALREGLIAPRANINSDGDIQRRTDENIMQQTRNMPYVLFPHASHTEWLACENCHPKPFVATAGANNFTMNDMYQGKFCGMCHDRVAFETFACERCHLVLHEGSPTKWW